MEKDRKEPICRKGAIVPTYAQLQCLGVRLALAHHHVIQVSDLHLSAKRAYNQPGWEACLSYMVEERPDFVAITGDHVLDDPDDEADHAFARNELDRVPVPWAAIPGNHDVGDLNPHPYLGQPVDEVRLLRYGRFFGADRWVREFGPWRLIGVNAFLLGSDMAAEGEQDRWLRAIVADAPSRPTALFLHKPLCLTRLDDDSSPDVCVVPEGRRRLLAALDRVNLRLVASGHNHHYRTAVIGGVPMVWAPSTGQILRVPRPFRGAMRPGVVHYWFGDDGSVEFGLIEPRGMTATDITDLIARYGAMRSAPLLPIPSRPRSVVSAREPA